MTQGNQLDHSLTQRLIKRFFDNTLDSSVFSLLQSPFFCAELVEGVILSHFYSLSFFI